MEKVVAEKKEKVIIGCNSLFPLLLLINFIAKKDFEIGKIWIIHLRLRAFA
jgi:hypothetical protein